MAASAMNEAKPCRAPVPQPPALMHWAALAEPPVRPVPAIASMASTARFDVVVMASLLVLQPARLGVWTAATAWASLPDEEVVGIARCFLCAPQVEVNRRCHQPRRMGREASSASAAW